MKRGPKPEDFTQLALTLGFMSDFDMFLDLYEERHLTIRSIAVMLGYSPSNIRRRMITLGIELHKPGRRSERETTTP